jgi:hypothetical protein
VGAKIRPIALDATAFFFAPDLVGHASTCLTLPPLPIFHGNFGRLNFAWLIRRRKFLTKHRVTRVFAKRTADRTEVTKLLVGNCGSNYLLPAGTPSRVFAAESIFFLLGTTTIAVHRLLLEAVRRITEAQHLCHTALDSPCDRNFRLCGLGNRNEFGQTRRQSGSRLEPSCFARHKLETA